METLLVHEKISSLTKSKSAVSMKDLEFGIDNESNNSLSQSGLAPKENLYKKNTIIDSMTKSENPHCKKHNLPFDDQGSRLLMTYYLLKLSLENKFFNIKCPLYGC